MSEFYPLLVSEVKKETPNSVSITFEIPEHLKEKFAFKAGQYVTLKYNFNGKDIRRAYSICSSPGSRVLKVAVKSVPNGAFSIYANTILKAGDSIPVMPPSGKFILKPIPESLNNYVAFAAGSGITPVLSLIKTVLESSTVEKFVLVFGNRSLAETMFHSELIQLQEDFPERFFVQFIYSRKEEENSIFGRIDKSTVNFILKNKFKDTVFTAYYLCGPEEMIDEVAATLKHNGINEKLIHHELFSTAEKGLLVQKHDGNTTLTVTVDDETQTFEMPQTKSILDATLDFGLDPPYSCQGGICSTCIARLKEGKVEMRKNQILTDSEILDGFILTCQAHPTTAKVVVDFDDL